MNGSRQWKTTLTGQGDSPQEALADLYEDPLAEHIKSAIYVNPRRQPSFEDISEGNSGKILGWEASATVIRTGALHE